MNQSILPNRFICTAAVKIAILLLAGNLTGCSSDSDGDISTGNDFNISGQVSNLSSSISGGAKAKVVSADYVYAVNIGSRAYLDRKKVAINQDGSFSIQLTKGESWILAFIDSTQVGFGMVKGIFKAEQLDAIAPKQSTPSIGTEVGTLTVDEFGEAKLPPEMYVTYTGNLGLTLTEASELALMDDYSLRYINPDIDANGLIDIDEANGIEFSLTSWQDYLYDHGNEEALLDSVRAGQELPFDRPVTYRGGSGPKLSIQQMDNGVFSTIPGKWTLSWTDNGNYTGGSSVTWATNITDTIWTELSDGYLNYSVHFPNTVTDIPDGTYTYQFYATSADTSPAKILTVTPVKTMDDASNVTNFIFPFPILHVNSNDDITSMSYTMMKWESGGFVPATSSEIELFIGHGEMQVSWDGATGGIGVNFDPANLNYEATGTIDLLNPPDSWIVNVSRTGDAVKRSDITSLSMSFVSRHGIWTELNINPLFNIIN